MERLFAIVYAKADRVPASILAERLQGGSSEGSIAVQLLSLESPRDFQESLHNAVNLQPTTDVVICWSRATQRSRWVRSELSVLTERWLAERHISLRLVPLDTARIPGPLRVLAPPDGTQTTDEWVAWLLGAAPVLRKPGRFLDRGPDIEAVEAAFLSERIRAVWLYGLSGIGKQALATEAARRIAPVSLIRYVRVREDMGITEVDLTVSAELGLEPYASFLEASRDDDLKSGRLRERTGDRFAQFSSRGGLWIVVNAHRWLNDAAEPRSLFSYLLNRINDLTVSASNQLMIITSNRKPLLLEHWSRWTEIHQVTGLPSLYSIELLRDFGSALTRNQLEDIAESLGGHPKALQIAAAEMSGVPEEWSDRRVRFARELIGSITLTIPAARLIELIALSDGPLPDDSYREILSLDRLEFDRCREELASYALVELDRHGYMTCHTIVGAFYSRSARERDDYLEVVGSLADASREFVDSLHGQTPLRADAMIAMFRLFGLSFRLIDSFDVRAEFRQTLVWVSRELYRERRYDEALIYLEEASQLPRDDDEDFDVEILTAQCLSGVGKVQEAREAISELPGFEDDPHLLRVRGRIEATAGLWREAHDYFDRAISTTRRPFAALLRDRGQARVELEQFDLAVGDLSRATTLDPTDAFAYYYLAQAQHALSSAAEAKVSISKALALFPANRTFHALASRIL